MKELIEKARHLPLKSARNYILLDTCFLVDALGHNERVGKLLKLKNLAITSFNAEEFLHIERRLPHEIRKRARKMLSGLSIIDIDVHPGEWKKEKSFVNDIEPKLLITIPDASDAVLAAAAIVTTSNILTKDRHHLFTAALENLSKDYNIKVCKELKDLT